MSQTTERGDSGQKNRPEGGFRARLERTAEVIDGLRAELEDEVEIRDQLIADALSGGESLSDVARWARLSRSRVVQVQVARLVVLQELEGAPVP